MVYDIIEYRKGNQENIFDYLFRLLWHISECRKELSVKDAFNQTLKVQQHGQINVKDVKSGTPIVSFNKYLMAESSNITYSSVDVSDLTRLSFYDGTSVVLPSDWLVYDTVWKEFKKVRDISKNDVLKAYTDKRTVSSVEELGRETFQDIVSANHRMYVNDIAVMTH